MGMGEGVGLSGGSGQGPPRYATLAGSAHPTPSPIASDMRVVSERGSVPRGRCRPRAACRE